MSKLAKNSIAAGLTTLLVTAGLSFSAQAETATSSYAEAQFVAGRNGLGVVVNALGDGLEDGGSSACEPTTDTCGAEAFTTSPLQQLDALTIPVGDGVTGSSLGAAGNYAKAGGGASRAASGAVTEDGIVHVGGGGAPATGSATFDLSGGALGDLGATDAVTNISGDIGAVSSSIELASPTASPQRSYNIGDANITLSVPALGAINEAIDASIADVDVPETVDINASTLCTALGGSLDVALTGLDLGPLSDVITTLLSTAGLVDPEGNVDLCDNAVSGVLIDNLGADALDVKISGLNAVTDGLTDLTSQGVKFNFSDGTVVIDLDAALDALGKNINDLPPSTDVLHEILPALALNLDDLLDSLNNQLVEDFKNGLGLEVTLNGTPVPLAPLTDAVKDQLLPNVQTILTQVTDGVAAAGDPLSEALGTITEGLANVAQILVNVHDEYIPLRKAAAEANASATSAVSSQTALELKVLGGQAADVLLANTLVGPNSSTSLQTDADTVADADTAADSTSDSDTTSDSDVSADGTDDSDVLGAEELTDSDSAADADVAGALADAGAPNLLPFFLLGLALLAFGSAVMLNERRRSSDVL